MRNPPHEGVNALALVDGSGPLWLFGGNGYDSIRSLGLLNDLWKFGQ